MKSDAWPSIIDIDDIHKFSGFDEKALLLPCLCGLNPMSQPDMSCIFDHSRLGSFGESF